MIQDKTHIENIKKHFCFLRETTYSNQNLIQQYNKKFIEINKRCIQYDCDTSQNKGIYPESQTIVFIGDCVFDAVISEVEKTASKMTSQQAIKQLYNCFDAFVNEIDKFLENNI